jgi:DNA-binding SARP family transcriptional activator
VLEISLFGPPVVRRRDRGGATAGLRPSEIQLLAFVALQRGRPVSRDVIAATLWADGGDATCRRRLNTTLWRLRTHLEDDLPAGTFIRGDRSSVMVVPAAVEVDVSRFEDAADVGDRAATSTSAPLEPDSVARLQDAVATYRGDLMEGSYDDWVIQARERLLARYLEALGQLLYWYVDRGDVPAAIATGHRLLERDPLREDVHRVLIRCFGRIGAPSRAIAQYRTCRALLDEQLGLEPMPETTAALTTVLGRTDGLDHQPSTGAGRPSPSVLDQLHELRERVAGMADAIDTTIEQLRA